MTKRRCAQSVCGILSDRRLYVVAEAGDGVAGVDSLRSSAADAVVMDIYMPAAATASKRSASCGASPPQVRIIAISGGTRGRLRLPEAAEMLGADRALRKPFAVEELLVGLDGSPVGRRRSQH